MLLYRLKAWLEDKSVRLIHKIKFNMMKPPLHKGSKGGSTAKGHNQKVRGMQNLLIATAFRQCPITTSKEDLATSMQSRKRKKQKCRYFNIKTMDEIQTSSKTQKASLQSKSLFTDNTQSNPCPGSIIHITHEKNIRQQSLKPQPDKIAGNGPMKDRIND